MIRTETLTIGGKQFVRTYSDANRFVVGGVPAGEYAEAIDPAELGRTYIEGGIISDEGDEATEEERALTRYANELTGENDPDLVSATESLIKHFTEE